MKARKFHMVGDAHLDPVWLWHWQEGFQETKATFQSALERMKEYDDFIFTSSSASSYEWIEENDPQMFAEIKARVQEGRWKLVGGWWVQPDCNIPSGESFVRQGLYGQRYFKEKFGMTTRVGYNVDSFGHHGMLPQILKKSGMDYYIFMRPMPNEKGLPNRVFWWESDDGSRILTYRVMYEYLTWGRELDGYMERGQGEFKGDVDELIMFYGVGNHGGGPTKLNIESIIRLSEDENLPSLIFSSAEEYFDAIKKKNWNLPVIHDDLQHHASGCYAAHSGVKRWNRRAENRLLFAEKYAAIASWLTRQTYPKAEFDRAWKNILFNQFHDILSGTSIEAVYEDARSQYGESLAIADRAANYALQSISWKIHIDQEEAMRPIVVFNPHAWRSRPVVEVEVTGATERAKIWDDSGKEIPFQFMPPTASVVGRQRLVFLADLPSLGYRTYRLYFDAATETEEAPEEEVGGLQLRESEGAWTMENQRFRLELDKGTGEIRSLHDKEKSHEVFVGHAARARVIRDTSDTWGHDMLHFNEVIGYFKATETYIKEQGPVRITIVAVSAYGNSQLLQEFTLYRDREQVDVKVTLDWHEQHKMLKLVFPVNSFYRKCTYEIPYGTIERENNGEEEPGQTWVDVTGLRPNRNDIYGVSLLNDAKYSYSIQRNELALTVVRSPIFAHHDPFVPESDQVYAYMDQGAQIFRYSLVPHEKDWVDAQVSKRAAELNTPPFVLVETYHKGILPQSSEFVSVNRDNIIISVIKKAEDSDGLIIRCYETDAKHVRAEISLPIFERRFPVSFRPNEIKTFLVPQDSNEPVRELNMLEWEDEAK